jgi:hypothetical protein
MHKRKKERKKEEIKDTTIFHQSFHRVASINVFIIKIEHQQQKRRLVEGGLFKGGSGWRKSKDRWVGLTPLYTAHNT